MKLVDVLARELAAWPETTRLAQDSNGHVFGWTGFPNWDGDQWLIDVGASLDKCRPGEMDLADDHMTSSVTRAEWQAAVDALNAPKVVEWDGVGSPEPGCSIEYSIGDGWYPCEVRYVLNRDDCPGIALIAWCEHLGKDQYISNDRGHKFRPARSAEQVAAEERNKAVDGLVELFVNHYEYPKGAEQYLPICRAIHDAGYRKEPKPCGS